MKGNFEGLKGYIVGRMIKSRRGKIYMDNEGCGPDAGSIEYGYRVPFGGIHVSAKSANWALSRTSAPTSSKWLDVQVLRRFSPRQGMFS